MAEKKVIMGKIGAPHGVKGWLKIHSFTQPTDGICNYKPWLIKKQEVWQQIEAKQCVVKGKTILALLPNCNDCDQARQWTNAEIAVYRHQLPELPANEYYWTDLEGVEVYNQDEVKLGVISHLFDNGANGVLVIQGRKQHLVPYIMDKFIFSIDLSAGKMIVNWDPEF